MQDSNKVTLLSVIMVNFETNSAIAEPIELPPHPKVTDCKKK